MQFVGRVAYEEDEPGPYFGLTLLLELLDKLIFQQGDFLLAKVMYSIFYMYVMDC